MTAFYIPRTLEILYETKGSLLYVFTGFLITFFFLYTHSMLFAFVSCCTRIIYDHFFSPTSIVVNAVNRVMFYCVMVVKLVII